MRRFTVYKSGLDGISGGGNGYSLDEACREISYSKGWESLQKLHDAIRQWGATAKPGSAFQTAASVIVCTNIEGLQFWECPHCGSEDLEYDELDVVESGDVEQDITCNACGRRWIDVFVLCWRRELVRQ